MTLKLTPAQRHENVAENVITIAFENGSHRRLADVTHLIASHVTRETAQLQVRVRELEEEEDIWIGYHDSIAKECKQWRKDAQELYGKAVELERELTDVRKQTAAEICAFIDGWTMGGEVGTLNIQVIHEIKRRWGV